MWVVVMAKTYTIDEIKNIAVPVKQDRWSIRAISRTPKSSKTGGQVSATRPCQPLPIFYPQMAKLSNDADRRVLCNLLYVLRKIRRNKM